MVTKENPESYANANFFCVVLRVFLLQDESVLMKAVAFRNIVFEND